MTSTALTAQQLPLIADEDIDDGVLAWNIQKSGEYTGERLAVRDPAKYSQVAMMLAQGMSVRYIKKRLRVAHGTVMAIRTAEAGAISTLKERLGAGMRGAAQLCVEEITDALARHAEDLPEDATKTQLEEWKASRIDTKSLAIILGILVDKSELLTGGATVRVESTDAGPGHSELIAYLEDLRTHAETMDLSGEESGQKAIDVTELLITEDDAAKGEGFDDVRARPGGA
jgi:hypothetical protein